MVGVIQVDAGSLDYSAYIPILTGISSLDGFVGFHDMLDG